MQIAPLLPQHHNTTDVIKTKVTNENDWRLIFKLRNNIMYYHFCTSIHERNRFKKLFFRDCNLILVNLWQIKFAKNAMHFRNSGWKNVNCSSNKEILDFIQKSFRYKC